MARNPHSPAFRSGLSSIIAGDVLVAPLKSYLSDPQFKGFTIDVHGIGHRPPDFWFHPSTHPSWDVRPLWLWMVAPELLIDEPLEAQSVLAMTAGSIWHAIVERSLLDLGLLVTNEVKFNDPVLKSRGSADGLMKPHSGQVDSEELFEYKTMKDSILRKIDSIEIFAEKYPTYIMQANEYLRMSGYRKMRFLLMALTFPFEMREFVYEYDPVLAETVTTKYRAVHQHIADRTVPMCSGCPRKIFCGARAVCESASHETLVEIVNGAS